MTWLATLLLSLTTSLAAGQQPEADASAPQVALEEPAARESVEAPEKQAPGASRAELRKAELVRAGEALGVRVDPLAEERDPAPRYLFASWEFVFLFLPVVLSLWALARRSARLGTQVLLAASLLWYAAWDVGFVPLIAGSIVVNWWLGKAIARSRSRALLTFAVVLDLLPLVYFKYSRFFLEVVGLAEASWVPAGLLPLVLPLGISFYTFQQIGYVVDVRAHPEQHEPSFTRYALFVLFFPQLVAGPIVQHRQFLPQLGVERAMPSCFARGCCYFAIGILKKLGIADPLGGMVDAYFVSGGCADASQALAAVLGYGCQLYFDFSAYSDMAIGLGSLFGLNIPINFDSPYKATSVTDFWRRWHMTLSAFLRDYVYIPLGGNRGRPWTRYRNLMATMLIGGLWHGAGYAFVLWGGAHGALLCLEHLVRSRWPWFGLGPLARPATLLAVFALWLPFRAEDLGLTAEIAGKLAHPAWTLSSTTTLAILLALATALWLPNSHQIVARISRWPAWLARAAWAFGARSGLYACLTLGVLAFLVQGFYERELDRTLRRVLPLGLNRDGVSIEHGDLRNNLNRCAALSGPGPRWVVVGPSFAGGMPLFAVPRSGEHRRVGGVGLAGQNFSNWGRIAYDLLDDPTVEVVFLAISPLSMTGFGPGMPFPGQGWDRGLELGLLRRPGPPLATLGPTRLPFGAALGALLTTSIRGAEYFQLHGFCRLLVEAATTPRPTPVALTESVRERYRRRCRELWERVPPRAPRSQIGRDEVFRWRERGVFKALAEGGPARSALALLVERARARGIALVVYETPTASPERAPEFYPADFWAQYRSAIRSTCQALGLEYWDLSDLLPWTSAAMRDLFHATPEGRAITLSTLCERWLAEERR